MTLKDAIVAWAGLIALAVTVIGLLSRGRWRLSLFFTAYVVSVFVSDFLMNVWREQFWTGEFWVLRQAVHDLLKMGTALEVGWLTFRLFPGAASVARTAALGILGTTAAATLTLPWVQLAQGWTSMHIARLHPPLLLGTIWLMVAVLAIARWYRVPVHPFHGGILGSLAAYMALFSGLLTVVGWYGGLSAVRSLFGSVDPPAYVLVTCWWGYLAWRPDGSAAIAHAAVLGRLRIRAT